MIRVLVVEDSRVSREWIIHVLQSDPEIEVIGFAENGREAVEFVARDKPDLITMDICMPEMDGFEATRRIMEMNPVPIIMLTEQPEMRELETSFSAIDVGALLVVKKPPGLGHPEQAQAAKELIRMVKLMAEIRVVRRRMRAFEEKNSCQREAESWATEKWQAIRVLGIGASTGGPPVIQKILAEMPSDFPLPILIVQHMARGFTEGFVEWLGKTAALPVQLAANGGDIRAGQVYVAPDGLQMKVDGNNHLICREEMSMHGLSPSVSYLFQSLALHYGAAAMGILLTGMGKDGAAELALMKKAGALTIAQDRESSIVFGMPGEAVRLNGASYVLPPERIVLLLKKIAEDVQRKGEAACRR
ncbi:chemotaxis protein CheB [Azotosporobacter soli]|uniref:chemotaxis protein CheB n=1 Tax=Azotosporobacter soli TaxID=3055040 RepID=UPI0031FEEAA9